MNVNPISDSLHLYFADFKIIGSLKMSKLKHNLQMLDLRAHKALKFQHQDQLRTINVFAYNCNCALLTINHPGTMRGNEMVTIVLCGYQC